MIPQDFPHATRAERIAAVRQWWLDNASHGHGSMSGARACAAHFGACRNTIRGLQYEAFKGECAPWLASPAAAAATSATSALAALHPLTAPLPAVQPTGDELRRDHATDAAKAREAARQPRPPRCRYWVDEDGLFQPTRPGEPLHICPTCGAQAFIHYELIGGFGIRNTGGVLRPQSLCRACRTNHGRQRRKTQLDIVEAISNAAPAAPAEASAYQNPPGLAGLLGGRR